MTATAFITLCESLYGKGWQTKLTRALVRDIRTIRRWKSGESPVPQVVQDWLAKQVQQNSEEVIARRIRSLEHGEGE